MVVKQSHRFIITLLLVVRFAAPAWADFQAGMDGYNRGDFAMAMREMRPLAEQGNAVAQHNLGSQYDRGLGVPQDYVQARQWYEKAATQGYAHSQSSLGLLYAKGLGVPQDYRQARHWWEKAAAQGDATAQYNLGALYDNGQGLPQDYVLAHMWYNLSGANGEKMGVEYRDRLARRMTPTQIAEAQELARGWKPK